MRPRGPKGCCRVITGPRAARQLAGDYLLAFAMTERRLLVYGATPDRRLPSPFGNVNWEQPKPAS
jgi:hypothetical protein